MADKAIKISDERRCKYVCTYTVPSGTAAESCSHARFDDGSGQLLEERLNLAKYRLLVLDTTIEIKPCHVNGRMRMWREQENGELNDKVTIPSKTNRAWRYNGAKKVVKTLTTYNKGGGGGARRRLFLALCSKKIMKLYNY
ncbi:predicted protein [Histoplasma capsulatum G186AR]|uniref:Uncharacterized protein n=1 Tax=Ajellomyces capsulatus (strain G186AR / H82 / ATCC MYA-2454 / RMSCC 2432) TaxID=447093 RepID=C0NRT8_AJECG|nr:uncharacterized protein HCBG_05868 [Histoplasma capsulatum G186AR]EEH05604.1 predicted protein [Histoplasma capsulatum G186AR]